MERGSSSLHESPIQVFISQPGRGVKLITGRHAQFKADFGEKI